MALNEDTLVQQTTADYLRDVLGWRATTSQDVDAKTDAVYQHVWRAYQVLPSPVFSSWTIY